ncbi:FAD binding domain-containing protein [Dactylonectria macrodidyma]|uniref:FAD binding domain-containing protein n=1 Tax=Dactylonectria macrodidyma TaxID=307937 RepID=A0A9P9J377_9HYPO|nr:FAD binding domain-containing protein [Dactylonectria macrodidyma]
MAETTTNTKVDRNTNSLLSSSSSSSSSSYRVIIAGAGPVGLFLALKLATSGINVDLLERLPGLSAAPRAAGYYGGAVLALKDAGLLHLAAQHGYVAKALGWRAEVQDDGQGGKTWGRLLCYIPFEHGSVDRPEQGMVLLPQPELCRLMEEQIRALDGPDVGRVNFHFNTELTGVPDHRDGVTVTVRHPDTGIERTMRGTLFVGADGGKSIARDRLGIQLQGHTWPERMIAADVMLRNVDLPPLVEAHFVVHPVYFSMVIPLQPPIEGETTLWRFSMATDPTDTSSDEELLQEKNLASMFERYMVGPRPLQYEVVRKTVYRLHQRLANTMATGRCALAGDAAHLNNPVGALGLTTGILDGEALAATIKMILHEGSPLSLLGTYSDERRQVFQSFVSPTSTANKLRIQQDPAAADGDWLVRAMRNPTPTVLREFIMPYMTVWRTDMRAAVAAQVARDAPTPGPHHDEGHGAHNAKAQFAHVEDVNV